MDRIQELHNFRVKVLNWLRAHPGWHSSEDIRLYVVGWQPDELTRVLLSTQGITSKYAESGYRRKWRHEVYDGE